MKMGERRRMLAIDDMPPAVDDTFDMRNVTAFDSIVDAFKMMLNTPQGRHARGRARRRWAANISN